MSQTRILRLAVVWVTPAMFAACQAFLEFPAEDAAKAGDGGVANTDGNPATIDGSPPPPAASEDCFDGRDDDQDGFPDCSAPSCAPYARCVPGPTAIIGWQGYSSLVFDGSCPTELPTPTELWVADTEAPQCAGCQCTPQASCPATAAAVQSQVDTSCQTIAGSFTPGATCSTVPDIGAARWWLFAMSFPIGSCAATTIGTSSLPAVKYRAGVACGVRRFGAGCPAGVCAPTPTSGLCISRPIASTVVPCPADFPLRHVAIPKSANPDSSFEDKRACSACSCGSLVGGSCENKLDLYSADDCSGTASGTASPGCSMVDCNGDCRGAIYRNAMTSQPSCAPAGGIAAGEVELVGAGTQYCCDR